MIRRKAKVMAVNAAHNRWWQTFEVVFGVPMAIAIVLQLVLPVSFPRGFSKLIFIAGGVALILSGGILIIFARREFAKHGQPTEPGLPTSKVVTTGVFSLSRNPLYLGGICMLVGIAFALDSPWVLLFLLPAFIACHYVLVVPEEKYLAATFGDEYRRYTAIVHRWIGRKPGMGNVVG
jgi:protein-S-isoprenylcysteine O-methyltransferase Ste14